MTTRDLKRLVRWWQSKPPFDPALRGWEIDVRFVPGDQLSVDGRDVYADVRGHIDEKKARIRVCRPKDMAAFDETLPIEAAIIHEMGHLLFDPNEMLANDAIFESALNAFAAVTLAAKARL